MKTKTLIARSLAVVFLAVQTLMMPTAHAAMIGTDQVLAQEQRSAYEERVLTALSRDDAADALGRFGVSEERIQDRLDRLSDTELAQLAQQAEELPTGEGALGVLVFVLVLLILLDLLGVTNVFPAISSAG
ncbi:MAG: hypothetical protein C0462_14675 [Alcanivorax sp.]|nr:hypothetical protein [Alcanivorax sp.]